MRRTMYDHWSEVDPKDWRWNDFSPQEIACRGTGKLLVNEQALDRLQRLRTRLGKPMILNSAYRSPEHNRRVGGARKSKHLDGGAFDVRMDNHDPQKFMAAAREEGFNGIGEYPILGFCHIDDREAPASWTGSRGKRFPVRTVSDRFAPDPVATPVKDAAAPTGGVLAVTVAAESILTDIASEAAPALPTEWITYLSIALGVLAMVRIIWPLLGRRNEDQDA